MGEDESEDEEDESPLPDNRAQTKAKAKTKEKHGDDEELVVLPPVAYTININKRFSMKAKLTLLHQTLQVRPQLLRQQPKSLARQQRKPPARRWLKPLAGIGEPRENFDVLLCQLSLHSWVSFAQCSW